MRVLAALPPAGPLPPEPAPPRAPMPWWSLLVGVALGVVLGLAGASWFGGAPAAKSPPPQPAQPVQPPDPAVAQPKPDVPQKPRENERPSEWTDQLQIMAFGELSIDEPGVGRQVLAPGGYMTAVGTLFDTGPSMAGIYAYANDVLRLTAPRWRWCSPTSSPCSAAASGCRTRPDRPPWSAPTASTWTSVRRC